MKRHIFTLLILSIICFYHGAAQKKAKYQYLIIQTSTHLDWDNDSIYVSLITDKENSNAAFIDSLVTYKAKLRKNKDIRFYTQNPGTNQPMFNYFKSVSECLQFLDENGWELFQVYGNTSGSNSVTTQPYYYLRKENR